MKKTILKVGLIISWFLMWFLIAQWSYFASAVFLIVSLILHLAYLDWKKILS